MKAHEFTTIFTAREAAVISNNRSILCSTRFWRHAAPKLMLLCCIAMAQLAFVPSAHAGFFDTVRNVFRLPEEMEQLKRQYNMTVQELEQNKQLLEQKLEQAIRQSDEVSRQASQTAQQTSDALKKYEESQLLLAEENVRLNQQNEQLRVQIMQLQQIEERRSRKVKQVTTVVLTAIGLVALYFGLSRLLRVAVRSR